MLHARYWSCTKFADFIRGTKKPVSDTFSGWDEWRTQASAAHPIRYWIAEEGFDAVQDFFGYIPSKLNDFRCYLTNRFVSHTNALTAASIDIKPGTWCDVGNRFLPCLFNELQDFVEIEKAWMHVVWSPDSRKIYNCPWIINHWWTRWFYRWRNPEAGIEHLNWEMSLLQDESYGLTSDDPRYNTPTPQAVTATEIKDLYLWWTEVYRNRPDPYTASGWDEICEKRYSSNPKMGYLALDEATRAEERKIFEKVRELEDQYHAEDEEMLIRLIKIRNSLWT
jgi:hypothetical protein